MTTNVSADSVPIPAQLSDLTAGWFSQALGCQVSAVPETLFVKLRLFAKALSQEVGDDS